METLNKEQQLIFNKYENGENVFMTGPGGAGKSHLIKCIVNDAEKKNALSDETNKKTVQVCALTGCASILLNCKATTLHRFAGIGLANKPIKEVIAELFKKKYKLKNWYHIKALIIDEISMMSLKILLILDKIARLIYRKPKLPFGGLQVIFSGDFYQLPPINSIDEEIEASMFCFEHEIWNEIFPPENQIVLKTIFRQEEKEFLKVLKYVRRGVITNSTKAILENRVCTKEELEKVRLEKVVTILFPYKKDAISLNLKSYAELGDVEKRTYKIKYIENTKKDPLDKVLEDFNDLSFDNINSSLKPEYEFMANNIMAEQILELKIGTHVMCVANIALNCDNQIANGSQGIVVGFKNILPIVKFNTIKDPICVNYYTWPSETNKNIAVAQIPLIYAWAITIHKSQGVSLDAVIMDIGRNIFEYGQSYVALSRVRTLGGLYLSSFDFTKISANPKVIKFYGDQ